MIHSKKHLLLTLLALSTTLVIAVSAQAQSGTPATLQVSFGSTPHWTNIHGTHVSEISSPERPAYDMFRYNGHYYAYNENRWYMSKQPHGKFTYVDERSVPNEFTKVPPGHWRNYPQGWGDKNGNTHANNNDHGHSNHGNSNSGDQGHK
jgi:hypothetical protein